jgi:hypothetical protein
MDANKKYRSHRCLPAPWLDAAFGEMAVDSMVVVSAVNAARPPLGKFGIEDDSAEEAEAQTSEDGEKSSDDEHSGQETAADLEVAAETDESEDESQVDESDDAAGEVDDAHNERQISVAKKGIAAIEALIDPGARPRRLGAAGVYYFEWGQGQRYDTTMYEIQRSRKRRRDVEEDLFKHALTQFLVLCNWGRSGLDE